MTSVLQLKTVLQIKERSRGGKEMKRKERKRESKREKEGQERRFEGKHRRGGRKKERMQEGKKEGKNERKKEVDECIEFGFGFLVKWQQLSVHNPHRIIV